MISDIPAGDGKTANYFLQCKVNAGPDQTFQFNNDMVPDPIPAPHQRDANLRLLLMYTLQRQNNENLKQIFPEKEYRGLSPNFTLMCL